MQHCIATMRTKEVINKRDGCRLGHVCDCEIDVCTGQVVSLVVSRGPRFCRYACDDDIRVSWCDDDVVGDDIILVCYTEPPACTPLNTKRGIVSHFFR